MIDLDNIKVHVFIFKLKEHEVFDFDPKFKERLFFP
jgi:hypothetical protein